VAIPRLECGGTAWIYNIHKFASKDACIFLCTSIMASTGVYLLFNRASTVIV